MDGPRSGRILAGYDLDSNLVFIPLHVQAMTAKERRKWMRDNGIVPSVTGGTSYGMFEMARPFMVNDGVAVTGASKTALTQDTIMTLPGNYFDQVGKMVWFRVMGKYSNVITTPGTYTFTLSWGGSGGTTLVVSGAMTPEAVAARTDNLWYVDMWVKALAVGALTTSLTLMAYGKVEMANDVVPSTQALWIARYMPPGQTAVANVASLDGTVAKALTLSVTPTVATGSMTVRDAWITGPN